MDRPTPPSNRGSFAALLASACLLLFPAALLATAAFRYQSRLLAIGTIAQILGSALLVRTRYAWKPPASGIVICLYLLALGWLWFATHESADWFARFGRGLFLLAAVGLLVLHDMTRTGLEPRRRARVLSNRLLARTRWPKASEEYAYLSEVWGLRSVVRDDPTLAFGLLNDPRPEVQLAALTALQDRTYWRWDQAAVVLGTAKKTTDPDVRAAAVRAVSTADNIDVTLGVIEYLKDPTPSVRAAACEALLAGGARRWAVARNGVRAVLADPAFLPDGPLPGAAGKLSAIAVCDLTAWAMEPPPLAERTARTLLVHYETVLRAGTDPALGSELGRQVTDPETPPMLRVELANLLRSLNLLPHDLLDRMTESDPADRGGNHAGVRIGRPGRARRTPRVGSPAEPGDGPGHRADRATALQHRFRPAVERVDPEGGGRGRPTGPPLGDGQRVGRGRLRSRFVPRPRSRRGVRYRR
jgi:hypothetical protein